MTEEAKPCPFCGMPVDFEDEDTLFVLLPPPRTRWVVPKEQWCWGMHCPTPAGGCGAMITGDSREEALAKWNTRKENK